MNPVKLKMFASTFLLIFFYFPKSMDGFVSTCDGRNCVGRSRTSIREFEQYPLKRENRVVNVRDRVGAERLVNNRRIVDSDSRISEYLESRNFDFPRLVERTHQSRVCVARGDFANRRVGDERNVRLTREQENRDVRVARRNVRSERVERESRKDENRKSRIERSDRQQDRDAGVYLRERVGRQDRDSRLTRDHQSSRLLNPDTRVRVTRADESRDSQVLSREARVENRDSRLTRDHRNFRLLNRDTRIRATREDESRNSRMEDRETRDLSTRNSRDARVSRLMMKNDQATRVRVTNQGEDRNARRHLNLRVTRTDDRDTRAQSRLIDSRDYRVENRISRDADVTRRERVSRNLNSRDTSRASETFESTRASESHTSRRDIRQPQRTNERNVRILSREVPEVDRRNVDVNNNRRVTERRDSRVIEHYQKNNDFSQWSHLLTTTIGVLLLAQIITSSETKKFGISYFLHGIKEKIY